MAIIHTRLEPWGVADVNEADAERLRVGNATMRAAIRIILHLDRQKSPTATCPRPSR